MQTKNVNITESQYLSDVYPTIESNTILCKYMTGIGATHLELTSKRHSIIIEPNVPPIKGKCSNPIYTNYNLKGVIKKVNTEEIIDYIENTIAQNKYIKILTTPESFWKVKKAFQVLKLNVYQMCFLLMDECHKFIKDVDYREDITLPMDDFFNFKEKSLVSATPLKPSDPRFTEQGFTRVNINFFDSKQTRDIETSIIGKNKNFHKKRQSLSIFPTNNVLEYLKIYLERIDKIHGIDSLPICIFLNSTALIYDLINKLEITDKSSVFCADKSVKKLKELGFKNAYEDWNPKNIKPFMFFTSRFYNALDIFLDKKPRVIFISIPFLADYTIFDPYSDIWQAVGRFRNGVESIVHFVHFSKDGLPYKTKDEIKEYVKAMEVSYKTLKTLYEDSSSPEAKQAFKEAMDSLPYKKLLRNDKLDYFALDNLIHDETVKSYYSSSSALSEAYNYLNNYEAAWREPFLYINYGDAERLSLKSRDKSRIDKRKEIVKYLESLENQLKDNHANDYQMILDETIVKNTIDEFKVIDPLIVEAYYTIGKDKIEECRYISKRLKEAIILSKSLNVKTIELIKNSFRENQKYSINYIKNELIRIYNELNIQSEKRVTAQTIRKYFEVTECKLGEGGKQRGFIIGKPII